MTGRRLCKVSLLPAPHTNSSNMGCWSSPNTKDAYRLSITSLVATLVAAIFGFIFWNRYYSSLSLVFGLENLVDFLSSVVVLWRFFAPKALSAELEAKLRSREQKASVLIGLVIFVLGVGVTIAALQAFNKDTDALEAYVDAVLVASLALVSIPVFAVLTFLKFRFANKLDSDSLYKDGICSLIGLVTSLALLVNTILIRTTEEAWWVDPLVALFAGLGAIGYSLISLRSSYKDDNLPIFSVEWWLRSQGSAEDKEKPTTNVEMAAGTNGDDDDDDMVDVL